MASSENPDRVVTEKDLSAFRKVSLAGCTILVLLGVIAFLSPAFSYGNAQPRPIRLVTGLFIAASLISVWSLWPGLQICRSRRSLIWLIVLFAICYRLLMIFTAPILEVDIYRYMWDGKVLANGLSPYRYSPQQVLESTADIENADYQKTVQLAHKTETLHAIVSRVHFEEYSTIYPPVSQWVFATTMRSVTDQASVSTHVYAMKGMLAGFDLATLLLVLALLRFTGRHPAWSFAYAWNPLVIKEVANSGHLDSIAVFLMIASIGALAVLLFSDKPKRLPWLIGSALLIALATGAKLFPVILLPALLVAIIRHDSWQRAILFAAIFAIATGAVLWPMARSIVQERPEPTMVAKIESTVPKIESTEKKEGLSGFLTSWQINDLVFAVFYENARPDRSEKNRAWYAVVPNETRAKWYEWAGRKFRQVSGNPAFVTARIITLAIFALAYLLILWRLVSREGPLNFLECLFFVLAAFFVLLPTQNPWYWLWALPLVCFVRNRGWLFASVFLLIYYLRFWFRDLPGEYWIGSYCYNGINLFDHVVVWLEHGAIWVAVLVGWLLGLRTNPQANLRP